MSKITRIFDEFFAEMFTAHQFKLVNQNSKKNVDIILDAVQIPVSFEYKCNNCGLKLYTHSEVKEDLIVDIYIYHLADLYSQYIGNITNSHILMRYEYPKNWSKEREHYIVLDSSKCLSDKEWTIKGILE